MTRVHNSLVWATHTLPLLFIPVVLGAIEKDRIRHLPGIDPQPPFKQYAGFLNATGSNKLFYWFTESENNPKQDPVVLWLNGGPGASSLMGLMRGPGPYRVNQDGKHLIYFKQRWNRIANMIFLDAPAGVGFSYNDDQNYTWNDDEVALNNHAALRYFFRGFPEYRDNEFFITGESYGGAYVPILSARLLQDKTINFKGFAVGNPFTNKSMMYNSMVQYSYYHGFIDKQLFSSIIQKCCQQPDPNGCIYLSDETKSCQEQTKVFVDEILGIGMNFYNYAAPCSGGVAGFRKKPGIPCTDSSAEDTYLNQADVREALHVQHDYKWSIYRKQIHKLYKMIYLDVSHFYKLVMAAGRRVLVYSGDLDIFVNYLGTMWFIDSLDLQMRGRQKHWTYTGSDGTIQVAGFVKQYPMLKFVIVKGAGHEVVPERPEVAFDIFSKFISNMSY